MAAQNILVIAAMDEEEQALLSELRGTPFETVEVSKPLGIAAKIFKQGQRTLYLARSGMGNVNSALTLALIAERYPVDAVMLLGVGGALVESLKIGDLVVSTAVLQHDSFFSLDFGHPRVRPGHLVFTQAEAAKHLASIPADPRLIAWVCGALDPSHVRTGVVLSGNEFVGTVERKRAVAALHGEALLVEMEAAGLAQVAQRLGLAFVVAKTVADRLCPDGTIESDFRSCLVAAAANAARVLARVMEQTL